MTTKRLPARQDSLPEFLAFVRGCAGAAGLATRTLDRVELVLEEALVNVFNYAFSGETGSVEVGCRTVEGPALVVRILDQGIPFNPLSLPDPDTAADASERQIGGLGVLFMRKMSDQISYWRDGDTNILTLRFFDRRG